MEIIRKQRINYTVTTTVIAAIFLLVVLGGLFGVVYGSNDMFINKALDKALEDPENYNNAVANDLRCIFIYKYDDGRNPYIDGKVDVYGDDATDIVLKAIFVGKGKFKYNDRISSLQTESIRTARSMRLSTAQAITNSLPTLPSW